MQSVAALRAGVPAPPDSPANVPGEPSERPGPSEPLLPGFPESEPEREREDGDDEKEKGS